MTRVTLFCTSLFMLLTGSFVLAQTPDYVLVIHGGAGYSNPETMPEHLQEAYHEALREALLTGSRILEKGGSALDAIEQTIIVLENNLLFNAGRGAVPNELGMFELDASIMDGQNRNAGATGGLKTIKNPISAARLVMEHTPHVMLAGLGADQLAAQHGLEVVPNSYFSRDEPAHQPPAENPQGGTVGAVALDQHGNLAAGTSTGGMRGKLTGRLGDSPIIAAGTFADNATCAVSCTGHGEYFIRYAVAYDVHARMAYLGAGLQTASEDALEQARSAGGNGGLISVDRDGNVSMPFNTASMFRGVATPNQLSTAIFPD